jgi:membrane-bound metal-dependent hydrolase YbcI (DUF457 family)
MRYPRIFLHALILPKLYIAYLLIKNAPSPANGDAMMEASSYYFGVVLLVTSLLVLFVASFITGRYKWISKVARKNIIFASIALLVIVDSTTIYYLRSISPKQEGFLTFSNLKSFRSIVYIGPRSLYLINP